MSHVIPKFVKQWNVIKGEGFDSLQYSEQPLPEIGDSHVLVRLEAASLNYRDLVIAQGKTAHAVAPNVIPGSDGAGTVVAVGKHVRRFAPGDRVVTAFFQDFIGGRYQPSTSLSTLGGALDGTFRTYGAFNEQGLVRIPPSLSFLEASTLTCAGVTAWSALFGLSDYRVTAGKWVLTQGTGGVSVFALQFAKAVGARVIATTGSNEKVEFLKSLGADYVMNYKEDAQWGTTARAVTGGEGVDHVVEVSGPASMAQSLKAVKVDGVIDIVGYLGGSTGDQPGFSDAFTNRCIVRPIAVGSRTLLEDLCRAVEANPEKLRPVIDSRVFRLDQLKEACEYQWSGQHKGKVCIEIS
ncbi:NAD(P)-binding protein [Trichoderma citrinoviride]|uniref:NAD(P)-binding protein n=1 Tax=Trichoderma citrinoviride TaxID=58853 RepID=A0A2T4B6Q5_9HYPO|nr:NAD(P)-binding protein [Trichoderma citrinoviride]PTB65013.1 NAD(P)-binding protein [Trichoderma citrinoviride]